MAIKDLKVFHKEIYYTLIQWGGGGAGTAPPGYASGLESS